MHNRFTLQESESRPPPVDPADAHLFEEWLGIVARVGLTVCVVEAAHPDYELHEWGGLADELDDTLFQAGLGELDSVKFGEVTRWYFYIKTKRVAEGLQRLRKELQGLELLAHVKIGYHDPETGLWRVFHPSLTETE